MSSSFPYKNPISPIQIIGTESVNREDTFGTNFSVLSVGGFMEVNSIDQLYFNVPPSTYGPIYLSANTIPVTFSKGSGTTFSYDTLTLNSDNISSGRKKLGMMVYVREEDQVYQFNIDNYETLWNAATGATGIGGNTVIISNFGTTVKANSPEGIDFISGWTGNTIEDISGVTRSNALWRKYHGTNLALTGGSFNSLTGVLSLTNITGGTSNLSGFTSGGGGDSITGGTINYSTGTLSLNSSGGTVTITGFTDTFVTGGTYSSGTATFTNNTGGTFNVTGFYTGNTDNDRYTTGFTYINNTFTLADNSGNTLTATINDVTGLTVNGDLTVTGNTIVDGLSADTFNIITLPPTNTTESSVLVRNSSTGDIEQRNINSLINTNNTITVALTGSTGVDFNSIKDAVNSITGATSANTYTVQVAGGVYDEDPFTIPSWVSVVGESSISTVIQANDSTQTLINLSDQSGLFDCQVQGCTDTNVSAILYSSSTTPQSAAISYVENVRFGSNYTHAKVVAYGGANIIMQCSNVKYGGQPFTVGFYATNSGSGVGRMQLRNVTSTNGGIVTTPGLIFAKADATNCGFIVNGCLLTKAVGAAAGTGFYVENGGFLRLTAVNFQRWTVGIDAPQIGSAPSIDAIALNFENNTIDVNIAHSGATGKIQGTDSFLKTIINQNAPLYEVNQDPKEITVAKKGGDFSSVKSAVDYLISSGNTSSTNRYIISVGPGVFTEDEIDLTQTPYVSIVGSNIQTTQILPNTNTQHIIKIGINNEISFLSLSGAPSGYAGIYCYDIGDFGQAHKISMYDCDTNIWVESDTQDTKFYGEYIDYNGTYEYGTKVIGNNGYLALANMENYFNFPTGGNITYCNYATGSGATLSVFVGDNQSNGVSGSTAFYAQDGAGLYCSTITVDGFTYGIRNPNIGLPCRFDVDNASFVSGEWDLYVERIGTFGTFGGSSNHEKVFTVSEDVYWAFLDINDGEFDITRKASVTFTDGSHTDFTTLIFEGSTMGLLSGGTLTTVSGFTVQADGGFGYLEKSDNSGIVRRIDWLNNQITLSANTNEYIYINENSNLVSSGTKPITSFNILLGRVITNSTGIEFIDLSPLNAEHTSNRFDSLFTEALGPIYSEGSIVTEGVTPFTLDVTQGDYHYSTNQFLPTGGTNISFVQYYRNGTGTTWVTSATTLVNNTQYDNNGTLTGLTAGYFTKHTLYTVGEGSYENYFLVLGQNEYSTLVATEDALLPTPPTYFSDGVVQIANIYIEQGTSGITQIEDIRPTIGFRAGGVNASSVHGNLLGLAADDHTQYLLVSGARAMSGNLDMGVNDITNVGTVDGVTVSAHAARHQFGGLDPVGSTIPSANAIPYADVSGTLNDWISTASTTTFGKVKTSSSSTTVISDNDSRFLNSFTGGSYSNGTISFTNNSGGTYNVTGLFTGATDVFVTGGTYSSGTATFTNNTGGTFNVIGFYTGDSTQYLALTGGTVSGDTVFLSGLTANTYSGTSIVVDTVNSTNNTLTESNGDLRVAWSDGHLFNVGNIKLDWNFGYLNDSAGLLSVDWENMILYDTVSTVLSIDWKSRQLFDTSGLVKLDWETGNINGFTQIESTTISATTYQNLPTDIRVTGGTYNNSTGTATFTNNTGGTFNVTGFSTGGTGSDTYVTGLTYSANVLTLSQNGGQPNLTATVGLKIKSGSVSSGSFTGTPRKATVTFTTAYPNTNYSINITGTNNRTFTYESKTTTSFVINTNANTALTGDVDWQTIEHGES